MTVLGKILTKTDAPVDSLILICEKCGKKKVQADQENPSSLIQKKIKVKIREELAPGTARAILTSCMNICPANAITIGHIEAITGATQAQFFLLNENDANTATELLFSQFLQKKHHNEP